MDDRQADGAFDFAAMAEVTTVEADRYCEGCGYNLRTQMVRRDSRTQVLLCRCPECGRYHPVSDSVSVGRVWLSRVSTLALALWIAVLISVFSSWAFGLFGVSVVTLEELSQSYRGGVGSGPFGVGLYAYQHTREYWEWVAPMAAASVGLGLAGGIVLVVVFPHWRRSWYAAAGVVVPLLIGAVVWAMVASDKPPPSYNRPAMSSWANPYVYGQALLQMLGGLIGVGLGRQLARLTVRILLPPRLRPPLAFLWLADGLPPPSSR